MELSPGAGAGLAERATHHNHRASGPHYVGGHKPAFVETAAIWQVDCGPRYPARGSLFRLPKCGKSPSRDMDSSGEFGKSRSSRQWEADLKHGHFRVQRTKRFSFAPTDCRALRALRERRTNANPGNR